MNTEQSYVGRGNYSSLIPQKGERRRKNHPTPAERQTNTSANTAFTAPDFEHEPAPVYVTDSFRAKFEDPEAAHQARIMLRSWFLAYVKQDTGDNHEANCALFEDLDEFFSVYVLADTMTKGGGRHE